MSRGALIVFEGCDRVGKSTQVRLLLDKLRKHGYKAETFAFPDRSTDLGKFIDQYLKANVDMEPREAHLVFSANRQAAVEKMRKKLFDGCHIVVDRYAYSGIAYTIAKKTMDLGLEWAQLQDVGILKPDCVIFFDLTPEMASSRSGFGAERLEALELQKRVYTVMKKLGEQNKDIWKDVDASLPPETVSENVWKIVEPFIQKASNSPLALIDIEPSRCTVTQAKELFN
uniref:Thymidylate kinase n=1 Tax=Syphacia muris TaxID=451379 RepID=A0A0N5AXB4_9BILA